MIGENMEGLISRLLQLTQEKKLNWMPITALEKGPILMAEYMQKKKYDPYESELKFVDYSLCSSYYIIHQNGLLILADILCQSGKNEHIFHKLRLLTKINNALPISDEGYYEVFDEKYEMLKLYIEKNLNEEYTQPDTLYAFWQSIRE